MTEKLLELILSELYVSAEEAGSSELSYCYDPSLLPRFPLFFFLFSFKQWSPPPPHFHLPPPGKYCPAAHPSTGVSHSQSQSLTPQHQHCFKAEDSGLCPQASDKPLGPCLSARIKLQSPLPWPPGDNTWFSHQLISLNGWKEKLWGLQTSWERAEFDRRWEDRLSITDVVQLFHTNAL